MKRKVILLKKIFLTSILISSPLMGAIDLPFEMYPENIVINNRILLKVNGKTVTLMDVVKKMDLLFYRQYPEHAESPMARYQFYVTGWRSILAAVLDDLLIVADAAEKGIEINDGEVREELEKLFGPDVVFNLDKLGMTLEEAFDLLKTELTVQRMMAIMVRSKAMSEVHPTKIKDRFEKWSSENPPSHYWVYQVLSFRGDHHKEAATKAYQLINEENIPLKMIVDNFLEEGTEINLSEEYIRKDAELSLSHKAVLSTLAAGGISPPEFQKEVSRIFCLKKREQKSASSFKEMEDKLKKELTEEAVIRHNMLYREKLRAYYGLTDKFLKNEIPDNLEPFALR